MRAVALAMVIPIALAAFPEVAPAQVRAVDSPPSTSGKIPIVRGSQAAAGPETRMPRPDPPPPRLTTAQKSNLLANVGQLLMAAGSWEVTPAGPVAPGRVAVGFLRPILVHSVSPEVAAFPRLDEWSTEETFVPTPGAVIRLWPEAAGRKYLLDCRVSGAQSYSIKIGSLEVPYTESPLLLVYEAPDTLVANFLITGEGFVESNFGGWSFHGCEITRVE